MEKSNISLNPYVRHAMFDTVSGKWVVDRRIWDYEIIYIAEGEMRIETGGNQYVAHEGDFVFLRPNHKHRLFNKSGTLAQPHVHFDMHKDDLSERIYVSLKNKESMSDEELSWFRKDDLKGMGLDLPVVITLHNHLNVKDILYKIINEYRLKLSDFEQYCSALMMELLLSLKRSYALSKTEVKGESFFNFNNLEKYILSNYEKNPKVDDLAEVVHLSKFYFIKVFTDHFGKTPHQYIEDLRFERSKELLRFAQNTSISDIADTLHFDSQQSFSKWFKKKSGVSPMVFIKSV